MSQENVQNTDKSTLIATDVEIVSSDLSKVDETDTKTKKVDPLDELNSQFEEICQEVASIRTSVGSVMSKLRQYKKKVDKALKDNQKTKKKKTVDKNAEKPKRAPSGITMPTKISPGICDFLGKPHNTQMARTDITREVYAYIKENRLQDKENKQQINPDDKLKKLLDLQESDQLDYFNLQVHLSKHFPQSKSKQVSLSQGA